MDQSANIQPETANLLLLSVTSCIAELSLLLLKLKSKIVKKRRHERKTTTYYLRRQNMTLEYITECMVDVNFALAFRLQRSTFNKLLELSRPLLYRSICMGERSNRPTVLPPLRLALCLRMMTGASVHDMVTTFHVDRRTAYDIFQQTRHGLNRMLELPGLPDNFFDLKKMAEDFQVSREPANPLPGCIGTLDGISIPIKKPVTDSTAFWSRKGYFALPVQAVCDSNYRFLCFSGVCKGVTHDSLAHSVSALGRFLEEEGLQGQFWIAGDEAYVCTTNLITPVPASQADDSADVFNFYHSSSRMQIEQAFGMLKSKWRILRSLNYSVKEAGIIVGLAMKLHNFSIDNDNSVPLSCPRSEGHQKALQESEDWFTEGKHVYLEQIGRPGPCKMNHLIDIIKAGNFTRPPVRLVCAPQQ